MNSAIDQWSAHPLGRAARIGIATIGLGTAVLLLLTATILPGATWPLIVTGAALAAITVRAAERPTLVRLGLLAAVTVLAPYLAHLG
jgi:hypothetical protein